MSRFLFLTFLLFTGCSLFYSTPKVEEKKPLYPKSTTPLDEEYFHSPTGDVAGHIPKGWLQVNTESIPEFENILAVYTDPDRARALVLIEIPGTADLRRKVERDGILAVAEESFQAKVKKHPNCVMNRQAEVFTENGLLFANYEYTQKVNNGELLKNRVVVFSTGVRFYELAMVELHPSLDQTLYLENFKLLQSVIAGLEGVATVKQAGTTP